jgi:hypothetical protein
VVVEDHDKGVGRAVAIGLAKKAKALGRQEAWAK